MSAQIRTALEGGVLTVTLDRADKRNALSRAMIDGLADALARAEMEAEVRVMAIRGAARKASLNREDI